MSTRTAALPMERSYLLKAWLVVAAIVIVAATVVALGLGQTTKAAGSGIAPVKDFGPASTSHGPIMVGDDVCGQCR